jgi:ABC-2 type transport system permease protein
MNIFLHEVKTYRKSTIIWTVSLILVVGFFMALYPAIANDADQFKKLLEGYPPAVRKAVGVSIDSITSLLGFYSYVFMYIVLCGSIQAMNLGISIIAKEVQEKTADFLFTKPVTRTTIMTAKLLAAFCSLLITNVFYSVAASIIATKVSKEAVDMKVFLLITITAFFVELMFMALGVIVSVIARKIKAVLPLSLSIVFGFFILNMFGSVIGEKAIRYFTPFKYYDTAYIIKHSAYEAIFIIIEVLFIIAAITASYRIYTKKDIHAV